MNGATIALLGMLAACAGLLRLIDLPGGGSGIFFLIVLAGAAFGPRFGLLLGLCAMAVSAIITGGIGPWLPFQMLALGWMGAGAGFLGDGHAPARSARRGRRAGRVRLGVGLPLRGDHEPLVLAVRTRRRARLAPRPRPRRRRCTATGSSTWPRRSAGTPPPRSPTRSSSCWPASCSCARLRRFAHRLDPAVEFDSRLEQRSASRVERFRANSSPTNSCSAARPSGVVTSPTKTAAPGAVGLERRARDLAQRGRVGLGADEHHDDVHVRTTSTADTARNRTRPAGCRERAVGSLIVVAPVATRASARNQVLRSSDPTDKVALARRRAEAVARSPVVARPSAGRTRR